MGIVTLVSAIVGTGVSIIGTVAGMGFVLWRLTARDNDALRADIRDIRAGVGGLRERMARIGGWFEGFARERRPYGQPDAADRSRRRPLGERT